MRCNTKGKVQHNLLLFAEVIPTVNQSVMSSRHFKGKACKVWNTISLPHSSSAKKKPPIMSARAVKKISYADE